MQLIRGFAAASARVSLATRLWLQLGYSWHLAWVKAERR